MQLNIIEECDGGFTQPSAVSGIRQDIMKPEEKKEENTVNRNSKDAGIQFRDYVEQTQDDINDYINVAGWDSIPSKTKVKINEFQTEFNKIIKEYNTSPRTLPLYKLWKMLSKDEQDHLLEILDNTNNLIECTSNYSNNIKKLEENT